MLNIEIRYEPYYKSLGDGNWTKIKTREPQYRKSIWFYAKEVEKQYTCYEVWLRDMKGLNKI